MTPIPAPKRAARRTGLPAATLTAAALALAAPPAAGAPPQAPDTLDRIVELPPITVRTDRPGDRAPIARSVLRRGDLAGRNTGQDTPMLLATLPGAYAYSDAGNGIGYSYLSLRGFPQRRISVLVNGVPLNDPESHEVWWIDHPDLLASAEAVEVQRGVGSALYGAASVGGSVHIETSPFRESPAASVSIAHGSFDTKRLMLEMGSGRLGGGWNLYGRYSRIETLGYRERSFSRLWSYTLAAEKSAGPHRVRVNLYGGPEETHLAYLAVPAPYLRGEITGDADRDRRHNPLTYQNERDHFFEPHYELIHDWAVRPGVGLTQTLFWFDGKGYYDERRLARSLADFRLAPWATADSALAPREYYRDADGDGVLDRDGQGRVTLERFDLVRRRTVENRHYGWIPRVRLDHAGGTLTAGLELRAHDGRHWGEVLTGSPLPPGTEPNHAYYDYHPRTFSGSAFAREEWRWTPALLVTADLAWRHQSYRMRGDRFDGIRFDQPYHFAVPRLGVTWTPRADVSAFASWSRASREPAFRDLYDAEGAGSVPLYRQVDVAAGVYEDPLIRPEKVDDLELGGSWRGPDASLALNLFRMDFRDELVYAGQFNTDLGYPILGNAARSVHQGIELSARAQRAIAPGARLSLDGNFTLGDHHFVRYREEWGPTPADVAVYDGNAIGFFPAVLGNASARLDWGPWTIGADVQHAGRIYLDHTESRAASIAPRAVANAVAAWRVPLPGGATGAARLQVFNLLDRRYETGGYMAYDAGGVLVPHYIPAATRHVLAGVRVDFR
jgi:iron complex outermembrane receptor protein